MIVNFMGGTQTLYNKWVFEAMFIDKDTFSEIFHF